MFRLFLRRGAWVVAVLVLGHMTARSVDAELPHPDGTVAAPPPASAPTTGAAATGRTVVARVVAMNQPFMQNRLGGAQPNGMVFALQRDVVQTGYKPAAGTKPDAPASGR